MDKFRAESAAYLEAKVKEVAPPAVAGTIYTCPMHPEIRQDHPGNCPKCGMSLEPLIPELENEDNPELTDFRRRFWWTLPLTVIVTAIAMLAHQFFHGGIDRKSVV